jgi:hypothetical protein
MEFSFLNRTLNEVRVKIEPWGDEFRLAVSSLLVVKPIKTEPERLVFRSELVPDGIVVWCESGATDLQVSIDGRTVRD